MSVVAGQPPATTQAGPRGLLPRAARWVSLGDPMLTAAYWGAVALYVAAFWLPRFVPLVDYPQHLGIASLLHRWIAGGAVERSLYEVNLFTYNASFHLLVALLAFVVPVEVAGRLVVSVVPLLFAAGTLELLRAARRPRDYALLVLPLAYNSVLTWGFVNNSLGFGAALAVLAWLYRAMSGEHRLLRRAALGGIAVAWLHIFAAFFVCAVGGIASLVLLARGRGALRARLVAFARTSAALLPAALLSLAFVVYNATSSHSNWENAAQDGRDEYAWRKVVYFADLVVGNFADHSDRYLFAGWVVLVLVLYWPLRHRGLAPRPLRVALACFVLLYLVVPRVVFATWFMFERFGLAVAVLAVVAAPVHAWSRTSGFRLVAGALALVTAANVVRHVANIPDEDDAAAILEAIPPGAAVQGLIAEPSPWPVLERQTWVHFQSYAVVRGSPMAMPSFTVIESMPVHYKRERRPPPPPAGFEWTPEQYSLDDPWVPAFRTVLARAAHDAVDPRPQLFGEDAEAVRLLARRGRFWLFDIGPALDARAGVVAPPSP